MQQELLDVQTALQLSLVQHQSAYTKTGDRAQESADTGDLSKVQSTAQPPADDIKEQVRKDPRALLVPDGTDAINKEQYAEKYYERVFVPRSVTRIRDFAFCNCRNLKEVVFEEGSKLRVIGKGAFYSCIALTKVTLPEGLENIGVGAFQEAGLESVIFPASLRMVGQGAFAKCEGLREVVMNDGLEVVGANQRTDSKG